MENLSVDYLGECEKFVISQTESLIIKGRKSEKELEARIADAKVKIEQSKNILIKQKNEARFAKLSGALAICYVGGITEIEVSEKKDRIDDSIRATKAAIDEGVVPGGGKMLLECYKKMKDFSHVPKDLRDGYMIVVSALKKPIAQICENNGCPGVEKEVEKYDGWEGYNAKTDSIRDLQIDGIVDPAKVARVCVESAVSTSIQVLTSEALIVSDN
jgi:chaperonin GroEL